MLISMFVLGVPFPKNFRDTIRTIFRRLFRVYAHLYSNHFDHICALGIEGERFGAEPRSWRAWGFSSFVIGRCVSWRSRHADVVGTHALQNPRDRSPLLQSCAETDAHVP